MPRALSVIPAAKRKDGRVLDTLILPYAQRQAAQKGFLFGSGGACIELDLPEPVRLRTDDALVLDDGALVEVVAEPEPLIELRANDLPSLARLAWYLGGRHVAVQVLERRLRLRRDPEVGEWLAQLGAKGTEIDAPFEPEGGAYEAAGHGHADHDHAHHHHSHDHHDHGDACGCGHDHAHAHSHDHGKR